MTVNPESVELTGYTGIFLIYRGMKIAEGDFQILRGLCIIPLFGIPGCLLRRNGYEGRIVTLATTAE